MQLVYILQHGIIMFMVKCYIIHTYSDFPAGSYSWWMVILLTPFMLAAAIAQAAIDNKRLAMNIIGAIVSQLHNYRRIPPLRPPPRK